MNVMFLTPSLTCNPIPACGESNKQNTVFHGLLNQQIENKLSKCVSNLGLPPNLDYDTILNDQFFLKVKLIGF